MGNRLSKITTRTGDGGETGLADGSRVAKTAPRIVAIGDIDELNACLGVLRTNRLGGEIQALLDQVQHRLFDLGGEFAIPGREVIQQAEVDELERAVEHFNDALPPLKEFILPGGSLAAAHCHIARTVCRRAERTAVTVAADETFNAFALAYLNRLSDLLFVLCRVLNRNAGVNDVLWQPAPKPDA